VAKAVTPVEIFCAYAHADEPWLRKLETHLSLLKRQGLISLWHDRRIIPGTDWAHAIDRRLESASVILLLVSADFLASDYCYSVEMKRALERQEAGEARVVPILVRPVDWTDAPFAHLQALPTDAKPIASWRNKDTAMADVVAGIRRVIEDVPLLAASAPRAALPVIWNIPYPRNPFFLGRESELAQVRHRLLGGQPTALSQPQAISGLGGIGKTQLALEYVYRYHQDYQAVLWARAESMEALISSYVAIASLLQLPEREAKEQEIIVQAVKIWLQTHRRWLLILDNADELMLLPDFLPPSLEGHLLLTTRAAATGRLAQRLEIATLPPEHGALFLLQRAGLIAPDAAFEQASTEEWELAVKISQELGGLPLALDQAGAYLEEIGMDLLSYWQIYQRHQNDLLRKRGGLIADHPEPIATTWSLSFQRAEEKNPAAADMLRLCAYLAPDTIAEEILTEGALHLGPRLAPMATDAFLLNQAIEALRAYSLVRRDPGKKTLSIHRLVQAVLQSTLEEKEQRLWAERAMLAVNAAFPDAEYDAWSQCERLLPQALAVTQSAEHYQMISEQAGRLFYETAVYLKDRARYVEAEPLFKRALYIQELRLGPEHPVVGYPLHGLAVLYKEQGRYAQAEPLYQRALRIWEQQLGPEHPQVVYPLTNLANLYIEQGKFTQAESLHLRALHIREQQLGSEHPQVAHQLHGLANLYYEQSKYVEAEPLYQRASRIWEQQLGPEHPQVAYPLHGLANLYYRQGKYEEAEPLYQRALRIWEQQLGPEHSVAASSLNNLANIYSRQGRYVEAESLYQRALRIWEHQLGPEHPQVAHSLNNLANLCTLQEKYVEAEPLYQRALRIREQALGSQHPDVAETLHNLAQFWEMQGNSEEARAWFARALTVREHALGAQHPETTKTRTRLIALLHSMGQHEEAAHLEPAQPEP
jgi:tetratricopeptide (TPR) repeat protein